MAAKGFGNSDGKRRVQIDRDSLPRDALRNLVYFKKQYLRALEGKRRDEKDAFARASFFNRLLQSRLAHRPIFMSAVAINAFHH